MGPVSAHACREQAGPQNEEVSSDSLACQLRRRPTAITMNGRSGLEPRAFRRKFLEPGEVAKVPTRRLACAVGAPRTFAGSAKRPGRAPPWDELARTVRLRPGRAPRPLREPRSALRNLGMFELTNAVGEAQTGTSKNPARTPGSLMCGTSPGEPGREASRVRGDGIAAGGNL